MKSDIIVIFAWMILPQFAYCECNYLISAQNTNSLVESMQDIEIELDEQIVQGNQNIGYGMWMKYQPFRAALATDYSSQKNDKQKYLFIYSLQDSESKSSILIFYIEISTSTQTIKHEIDYSFQTLKSKISVNFNFVNYEGKWILFYFYFNYQSKSTTITFLLLEQNIDPKVLIVNDVPTLPNTVKHTIGGNLILDQDQGSLVLSQFQGKLSQLFSERELNVFEDRSSLNRFLQHCKFETQCKEYSYQLTQYDQEYRGFSFTTEITNILEFPIYTIQGWVKIKQLQMEHREMVIFRITINKEYNDDFIIGDKELYLKYQQDQQPILNGFEITTYSYAFPTKSVYQSSPKDIKKVLGVEYQQLLINWHYIQYEIGTINNERSAQFQIYFPSSQQQVRKFVWEQPIIHFSGITLRCYLGGDKYTQDYMNGYFSDLILKTYCTPPVINITPKCHYSCQTCNGPNFNNCLTCPPQSNRILLSEKNTCPCNIHFVDTKDQSICKQVVSIFPTLKLLEKKRYCHQNGYLFCDLNSKVCAQGYFLYNNQTCLECPGYSMVSSRNYIKCSNCISNPTYFSSSLQCTEDRIQQEWTCSTKQRLFNEIENYIVIINSQNKMELKLNANLEDCQYGYFKNIENQCLPCQVGCFYCKNYEYCIDCKIGYFLNQEFQCTVCQGCNECQLQQNSVICHSCHIGAYLNSNGICSPCGEHCGNCDNNRKCYYCDNPEVYFLAIDGQNCLHCQITNCIYCYHYYIKENLIYSTLDVNFEYDQKYYSTLKIGCALCKRNYYFNQITSTCEIINFTNEEFNENELCLFGLITDNQQTNYCLISSNNLRSIQNKDCSNLYNCVECIQNYSQETSFCIICEDGYYSSILRGECEMCDYSCKTCIQRNKLFKDDWKWNIKAYYKYVFNSDNQHPFEEYAILQSEEDFELICTSCPYDYILYEHQCIYDCDYDCTDCQIIDGVATCMQCNNNQEEIKISKYLYECKEYQNCYYQAVLAQNIYCSKQDFETQIRNKNQTEQVEFKKSNIYIEDLFSLQYLELFSIDIIRYLDDSQIREVEFEFTLIQGSEPKCLIKDYQTLQSRIFDVYKQIVAISLKIIGSTNQTTLQMTSLNIIGFTSITFEIIQFDTSIMFDFINANQVVLRNCVINSIKQFATNPYMQNLNLTNLEIRNLNIINSTIFDQVTKNCQIYLNRILITYVNFQNSSLFYLYPKLNNTNSSLIINEVSVYKSQFYNSFLFKTIGESNEECGSIFVDNIYLNFVSVANQSSIFQIIGATIFQTQNINIIDSQFIQQSYFYQSNIIQIQNIKILDLQLIDSTLFSNNIQNQISDLSKSEQENVFVIQCKRENVQYNRAQSFFQIIRLREKFMLNAKIEFFYLKNCTYTNDIMPIQLFYNQSSIYIECQYCTFNDFEILRGYGLPEMSVMNSKVLQINTFYLIQMDQYYFKTLHPSLDCANNYAKYQLSYYLYFGFFENITIHNLHLNSSITYDYPFIIFRGFDLMEKTQNQYVIIKDSIFDSNMLIIKRANGATSLISIKSEQNSSLLFYNVSFQKNHLNSYFQDTSKLSASTLFIYLQQGEIQIANSVFIYNLVTNSTDSIMQIKAVSIMITNSSFYNSNIITFSQLSKNLLIFNQVKEQAIKVAFPINSKSGNGILIASNININKVIVQNSKSYQGGGFSFITYGTSTINIEDSQFSNSQASLSSSSYSVGGCIYIDAYLATLRLIVANTIFEKCYSRREGGGLYIIPSSQYNFISMKSLQVSNCFSIQNTFLSYTILNLENFKLDINLTEIYFTSTQIGFIEYLKQLEFPTELEIDSLRSNNPIIMIKYGNINIVDCNFYSIHIQSLIQIEDANNAVLENIRVINSSFFDASMIKISLKNSLSGEISLRNLTLLNISEFENYQNYSENSCSTQNYDFPESLICKPKEKLTFSINLNESDTSQHKLQYLCNLKKIYDRENNNFSLIQIEDINENHKIKAQFFDFHSINCTRCLNGLISILNINQIKQHNILFQNIKIINSFCGYTGCLSIMSYWNESILKPEVLPINSNGRQLQQHDYTKLALQQNHQVKIIDSLFLNNSAIFGGSLFVIDTQVMIQNCRFQNNSAIVGGAIYYYSKSATLCIFDSFIIENKAQIVGGLFLNQQSIQQTKQLDVIIFNNTSTKFGEDVFESPRSLTISTDAGKTLLKKKQILANSTKVIEKIEIQPYKILGYAQKANFLTYPSGISVSSYQYFDLENSVFIPYNLTFRIIPLNIYQQQMKKLTDSFCTISHDVLDLTNNTIITTFPATLSQQKVEFNQTSQDFNLDNLIINFHPLINENVVLRLKINCNMIKIPQFDAKPPYQINSFITDYDLVVDIKTFKCQLGEYLNTTSGSCSYCDPQLSQYSVQINAQKCNYIDDQKMESIKSSMIELKQEYWRAYYYSDQIEQCYHEGKNCRGGWQSGDQSCSQGHIGALCEQCDLYNIRGDGSYSVSSAYQCGNCDQIVDNVLTISLISIWTLISILISVLGNIRSIEELILGIRLKSFKNNYLNTKVSSAIQIKVFTNYFQIISTIATFQLQVPTALTSVVQNIGNPVDSMAYSFDCFLINLSDILIIYFRIIWSLVTAASFLGVFFFFGCLAILIKIVRYRFSFISTPLLYIFLYMQPNLVGGLISLLSYRRICNDLWIQGNVAYRYDTKNHLFWVLIFCLPLIIIFALFFPVYFFYKLKINKTCLDKSHIRQIWGYLYNEYKQKAYFWEIVKILQKELIIVVLAYYEDHIPIKASLVFLSLSGYIFLAHSLQPYYTGKMNQLDREAIIICAVSIILASQIFLAQESNLVEIIWPCYFIIGMINTFFIFKIFVQILFAYFNRLNDQIDKLIELIIKKFPNLVQSNFNQNLFKSKKQQKARIKERFAKIKDYLIPQARLIIQCRRTNRFELPIRTRIDSSHIQNLYSTTQKLSPAKNTQNQQSYLLDQLDDQKNSFFQLISQIQGSPDIFRSTPKESSKIITLSKN
ncbi:unnamed protein product (macronuclear) [Paramecium tetraurelia]|uniref:Transmembrane protein n=1 Tax=Paramecium tetraurelia TaxID=5888 RepID=A0BFC7_PARTE|nr:uncharacterized protein GSPATT00028279001 [Paramecium tetraurelia]CAK57244.1 unnamed protein product [Paramecium tetraurelia]|eukprot:XP_001424642.1 hypothetical protein (macronuclear) [Paramecium tetraurelia strain d4-2]